MLLYILLFMWGFKISISIDFWGYFIFGLLAGFLDGVEDRVFLKKLIDKFNIWV